MLRTVFMAILIPSGFKRKVQVAYPRANHVRIISFDRASNTLSDVSVPFERTHFRYIRSQNRNTLISILFGNRTIDSPVTLPGDDLVVEMGDEGAIKLRDLSPGSLWAVEQRMKQEQDWGLVDRLPRIYQTNNLWIFPEWLIQHTSPEGEPLKTKTSAKIVVLPKTLKTILFESFLENEVEIDGIKVRQYGNAVVIQKEDAKLIIPWEAASSLSHLLEQIYES